MANEQRWTAIAKLAAEQHGAFHRSQAFGAGLDSRQLRRAADAGRLHRPLSDVYVFASQRPNWTQRLMVTSLAGAYASHRAAATLHHLDGFAPGKVEVTFPRNRRRPLPAGVQIHQSRVIDAVDLETIDGIICSSLPLTLIELAQVLPPRIVEHALDSALRAGTTEEEISETVDRLHRPGRVGTGRLRSVMHDPTRSGAVPDSLFERIVERLLLDKGFPAPVRQHEVVVGRRVRRLDLSWPDAKVGVEAHSKLVHFGKQAAEDDNHRDLELAAEGWEVLYLTWAMAKKPDFFLRHLREVLRRRLPDPSQF